MSDDKGKQDGRDDSQIDIKDASEVQYAAKKLGVTPQQIRDAVANVGNSRAAAEKHLKK
jgi:hypothetical protein